ncbi:signal transduction histidine kinase [Nocardioides cavernae]|uniref:Sensor-like histidine kinase SenX3 n=1 Tax=Nocardioides cavernae TaxID=1921566 RepID=A0A7Y9H1C9_9ACTN|nr:HAMP domain-containing sensor histidine kinase [Nocardioides cavernae]NYE36170.1 signal transduction histidine kinase [Nocardioides cavernae]
MEQLRTGERRTRDLSWGDVRARALMHALARDAATRAGFRVCAIEVVRPKGLLEFVAIYGDMTAAEERLGTASRLSDMQVVFADGEAHGHFIWIPDESFSDSTRDLIDGVVVIPDIPATDDPDAWHPMDMLAAQIADERGDLRALLYLDVPTDLRRPDRERLLEISDELAMTLRSVVTLVEREEFADHMRVIRATRRLARSNTARHDVKALLREARTTLLGALSVDELEIRLFLDQDSDSPDSLGLGMAPEVRRTLDEAAARAWAAQRVLIIEPGHVWGDAELAAYRGWFTDALRSAGFEAIVLAPVGVDDEVLGMLMCARRTGSRRWTDGEGVAALELGHDLGRAIANAHATQRERRLLRELRDLEESRHRFLRELTHEINNPMTVIAANAEFLATSESIDDKDLRRAQAILRGSERLGDLLQGLAMLSRVSDPQHPPTMQHVDLLPIVEETLTSMSAVAERAGITLHLVGETSESIVFADPKEIASAVTNLVDNAVKYSDPGDEIWLGVERRADGGLTFGCRDEGIGISDSDQSELFSPLFRSTNEEALLRPGTGLGLGIVREIMHRHGGTVEVESVLGRGTSVRLHFRPLERDDVRDVAADGSAAWEATERGA